jgi:excisionase family DNA binding protein
MQAYATPATGTVSQLRLVDHPPPAVTGPSEGAVDGVLGLLLGQLAELVAERVVARLAEPTRQAPDEWLDSRRAAEYLGIGRDSLRRLAAEGAIPSSQAGVGCKLFFRRSDLDWWRCSARGPIELRRRRRDG